MRKKIHTEEVCRLILQVNAKVTEYVNSFEEFEKTPQHVLSWLSEKKSGTEESRVGRVAAGQS